MSYAVNGGVWFDPAMCIPFPIDRMVVLGSEEDPGCSLKGSVGYEKTLTAERRTRFCVAFEQSGVGSVFTAAPFSLNLLAAGTNATTLTTSGTSDADAATLNGYPAALGNISRRETNLYKGGIPCRVGSSIDPGAYFMLAGLAVRALPLFYIDSDGPATNALTYGEWLKIYQSQVQQIVLDSDYFTLQQYQATCFIELQTLSMYPTQYSSGMETIVSQNGVPIKGNVYPLCKAVPIGNIGGTQPDWSLFVSQNRTLRELFNTGGQPVPNVATTIYAEIEVVMFGWCEQGICLPCRPGLRPRAWKNGDPGYPSSVPVDAQTGRPVVATAVGVMPNQNIPG